MAYSAADVKKLRDETDAPMMECKAALDEAEGDYERAKTILREKGKAAAAKRSDRSTAAGVVAVSAAADNKTVGAVVLESETDFVARNEGFVETAEQLAKIIAANDPAGDPLTISADGKTVGQIIEEAVAKFRENIKLTKAIRATTTDNEFATYVHHDRMKGMIVEVAGSGETAREAARQVAIQAVAHPPQFISRDQVPQDFIDQEIETETKRAINEGKPENIAKNIAQGRVNKEFMKSNVLLEQPFFRDGNISVGEFLKQEAGKNGGGAITIVNFIRLAVGEGS